MLFVAHEYIVRQAANHVEGLGRKLLPAIVLGSYFPDIKKLPISRFYKGNTHFFSENANAIRHTQQTKAYAWGWQLHILADFFWHKRIYSPMESPICTNVGKYDPIRQRRMSDSEHIAREIALDLYLVNNSGITDWGAIANLSLRDIFHWRGRGSELGFWCYKKIATAYTHCFMPHVHVLTRRGFPRILAWNYTFITEEVSSSVNKMLEKTIAASVRALQKYLEEDQK